MADNSAVADVSSHSLNNLVPPAALPSCKRPGKNQGRYRAADYDGCDDVYISHDTLHAHGLCPHCAAEEEVGKLYSSEPGSFVCLRGQPLIGGTRYTLEKLRCNTCGTLFTATLPAGAKPVKYEASCSSAIALSRYTMGVPFHRLASWQALHKVPLPDATQWDKMKALWAVVRPVNGALEALAAEGHGHYFDDTPGRILHLPAPTTGCQRKGVYTTAIISEVQDQRIYLFYTSQRHAGGNTEALLKRRQSQEAFFTMSDALAANTSQQVDDTLRVRWIICFCLVHGRRKFFELLGEKPSEVDFVLDVIEQVYAHERHCIEGRLTPEERLLYHRGHSLGLMKALRDWLNNQFLYAQVEPNSRLGKAMQYLLRHWKRLTRFLHVAGVPMDNSLAERTIKIAIRHRRNSLFYRTLRGAKVGDDLMGLIYTAAQARANAFAYLNALQDHAVSVREAPERWLPWNYETTLQSLHKAA